MNIKYAYTILYVADVAKSVAFYEAAFGFERKFITPENDYAELLSDGTTIAFASLELAQHNLKEGFEVSALKNKPFGIELGFVTDDVEEALLQAQKAGAIIAVAPVQKPWGQTVAYIRDLDGFLIELCTVVG